MLLERSSSSNNFLSYVFQVQLLSSLYLYAYVEGNMAVDDFSWTDPLNNYSGML